MQVGLRRERRNGIGTGQRRMTVGRKGSVGWSCRGLFRQADRYWSARVRRINSNGLRRNRGLNQGGRHRVAGCGWRRRRGCNRRNSRCVWPVRSRKGPHTEFQRGDRFLTGPARQQFPGMNVSPRVGIAGSRFGSRGPGTGRKPALPAANPTLGGGDGFDIRATVVTPHPCGLSGKGLPLASGDADTRHPESFGIQRGIIAMSANHARGVFTTSSRDLSGHGRPVNLHECIPARTGQGCVETRFPSTPRPVCSDHCRCCATVRISGCPTQPRRESALSSRALA